MKFPVIRTQSFGHAGNQTQVGNLRSIRTSDSLTTTAVADGDSVACVLVRLALVSDCDKGDTNESVAKIEGEIESMGGVIELDYIRDERTRRTGNPPPKKSHDHQRNASLS